MASAGSGLLAVMFCAAAFGQSIDCSTSAATAPQTSGAKPFTVDDILRSTRYQRMVFSNDGAQLLTSSNEGDIFNVHALSLRDGRATQLTHSTASAAFVEGSLPGSDRFLFTMDQGGNEVTHLYVSTPNGEPQDLIPEAKARTVFLGWSRDRGHFFLASNRRDPRTMDVYQVSSKNLTISPLYENTASYDVGPLSPDGRYLALTEITDIHSSLLHVLDLRSKRLIDVTPNPKGIWEKPIGFSTDGRYLYLTTDHDDEFKYLVQHELSSGKRTTLLKRDGRSIETAYPSTSGRYMVAEINMDGRYESLLLDLRNGRQTQLLQLPHTTGAAFSNDERQLALSVSSYDRPGDLFVVDLARGGCRELTHGLNPAIDPQQLVKPQVVRFRSADGLEIPALLYRPRVTPKNPAALIRIHGGPGGQASQNFLIDVQLLVQQGYAVVDVNNRGSAGYGKTFHHLDDRRHVDADLPDIVAAKKMLVEQGLATPDRVGVMGGSYGGFLTLASLTFAGDEFAVGVDLVGPTNWVRVLSSTPPWWKSFRAQLFTELGDPNDPADVERLNRISPLIHADRIKKPLLVIQGENDPRVLRRESDELVATVKRNGVPVRYEVLAGEGHATTGKAGMRQTYNAILEFLASYLPL